MGHVRPFGLSSISFEPETLVALGAAYDLAITSLNGSEQNDQVREVIAEHILIYAEKGERDVGEVIERRPMTIVAPAPTRTGMVCATEHEPLLMSLRRVANYERIECST